MKNDIDPELLELARLIKKQQEQIGLLKEENILLKQLLTLKKEAIELLRKNI